MGVILHVEPHVGWESAATSHGVCKRRMSESQLSVRGGLRTAESWRGRASASVHVRLNLPRLVGSEIKLLVKREGSLLSRMELVLDRMG